MTDPEPQRVSESERQLIQLTASAALSLQSLAVQIAEIDRLHERCKRLGITPKLDHVDLWDSYEAGNEYVRDLVRDFLD